MSFFKIGFKNKDSWNPNRACCIFSCAFCFVRVCVKQYLVCNVKNWGEIWHNVNLTFNELNIILGFEDSLSVCQVHWFTLGLGDIAPYEHLCIYRLNSITRYISLHLNNVGWIFCCKSKPHSSHHRHFSKTDCDQNKAQIQYFYPCLKIYSCKTYTEYSRAVHEPIVLWPLLKKGCKSIKSTVVWNHLYSEFKSNGLSK